MSDLTPVESIVLTIGLAQVKRGEEPSPRIAAVCILALARMDGRYDWTLDEGVLGDDDEAL